MQRQKQKSEIIPTQPNAVNWLSKNERVLSRRGANLAVGIIERSFLHKTLKKPEQAKMAKNKKFEETEDEELERLKTMRINLTGAAYILGVHPSTVGRQKNLDRGEDGCYSLMDLIDYFHAKKAEAERIEKEALRFRQLEVEKLEYQVQMQKQKLEKEEASLIDREYFKKELLRSVKYLTSVAKKIGRKKTITGPQAHQILNNAFDHLIQE